MTTNTTTETLIEALARAVHEHLSRRNIMQYLDNPEDCEGIARACIPVIQAHQPDSDALLREAREACFRDALAEPDDAKREDKFALVNSIDAFLATPTAPSTDARRAVGPRDDQSQLLRRFLARHYTVYLSDAECRAIVDFFDERPLFDPFWRPIETVPKDGSPILLFDPEYCDEEMNPALQGHWSDGFFAAVWNNSQDYFATVEVHPTYWTPLPRIDRTQPDAVAPSDAGALLDDEDGLKQLRLLYNHAEDDSRQFTRWQMVTAINHGIRLAALKQPSNSAALRASTGTEGEGHAHD